ncbi:unnamed protein product [Angiostrongylus costaricensis]|uniref:Protein kinase domain-containing protein n=1 Tax=Angiostrongylus costaricensis TaxID=334426 RepID=A0A0R3PA08_ANGCS|nr:unnamed protein product [Angiostrongylus costaricensis]
MLESCFPGEHSGDHGDGHLFDGPLLYYGAGLARQYIDSSGLMRKPRESIGMRGTLRYVSLEAHARHDLGPSHDLVALLYSIIELGDGGLPWSKMRDEAAIKASKMGTTVEKLCQKQPKMLKMAEVGCVS